MNMSKLANLLTEARNPSSQNIDQLSTTEMLQVINAADREIAAAVEREIPNIAKTVDIVAERFEQGGHLFYIGAGTSGRLGVLDASECPPTFSVAPELVQGIIAGGDFALRNAIERAEDDPAQGAADLQAHGFTAKDVLVGIASSGRTPYVLGAVEHARSLGAVTVGLSCVPDSELARSCDIAITPAVGPEILTGSTRMKAGTATKLALNMISTGVMIRTGLVYGNLMVNVKPTNAKLVDRAQRIIAEATGADQAVAAQLLEEAGSVKTAIVMQKLHLDRAAAEEKLAAAKGRIREALNG